MGKGEKLTEKANPDKENSYRVLFYRKNGDLPPFFYVNEDLPSQEIRFYPKQMFGFGNYQKVWKISEKYVFGFYSHTKNE